ncbi:MAG: hypothetical protein JO104_00830 [Candidatus Eremiobacteraeota bacterium]|nr:hypothetical protein [Candidatus Eremiobacteraeota bacterium]
MPQAFSRQLPAPTSYKVIYSFGYGKASDGDDPVADLIVRGGKFYGTTQFGGKTNGRCYLGCGTVFTMSSAGVERVLYRFKGGTDGAAPAAGLIALDGAFFGTTSGGGAGSQCAGGCGTVFEVSADGKSEKILHSFSGGSDGATPVATLVAFRGFLYGATEYGGLTKGSCFSGCGTIFSVSTTGTEKIIYRFKGGKDGAQPVAPLSATAGVLYGTTQYGGLTTGLCSTGCGTIFRLSASGEKKTLYRFTYAARSKDGAYPAAGLLAMHRELYGTTIGGGLLGDGVVFKVNESSGAETVVHRFSCCVTTLDGAFPFARLADVNGTIYGTTRAGGAANAGAVFAIDSAGTESVLYSFQGHPDGAQPQARVTLLSGVLYGTTTGGGSAAEGSVFRLAP